MPHALLVTSKIARVLAMLAPGRAEGFYLGASEPATTDTDASGPVDFDRLRLSAERNGAIEILVPPLRHVSDRRPRREGVID